MRVKVSLMGDVCCPVPLSFTVHDGPCFEMPTPMMWPPGLALRQNKLTATVFHKQQFIVLDEHDCGHLIPHITIPPTNPKLPLYIAFSKRKVMFASSKVKANGAPVGCTQFLGPFVPMLCCGSPVSLPNGFPSFNWLHTASVGLSMGDIAAGLVTFASSVLGNALCRLKWFDGGYEGLAKELVGSANLKGWLLKAGLGCLSGAARIALTGEGKRARIEIGSGYAGMRVAWRQSPEDRLKAEREYQVGPMQVGLAHSDKRDGTSSDQSTLSVGSPIGTGSSQLTNTYDSNGNLAEQETQRTATGGVVDFFGDGPADTAAISGQNTTTLQADGHATSTTVGYAGSSSAAGSWGMPL